MRVVSPVRVVRVALPARTFTSAEELAPAPEVVEVAESRAP